MEKKFYEEVSFSMVCNWEQELMLTGGRPELSFIWGGALAKNWSWWLCLNVRRRFHWRFYIKMLCLVLLHIFLVLFVGYKIWFLDLIFPAQTSFRRFQAHYQILFDFFPLSINFKVFDCTVKYSDATSALQYMFPWVLFTEYCICSFFR